MRLVFNTQDLIFKYNNKLKIFGKTIIFYQNQHLFSPLLFPSHNSHKLFYLFFLN